jgi:hypothetical protein
VASRLFRPVARQRFDDPVWDLFPWDKPPAAPGSADDEFDDGTIAAAWSWRNQGGASIAEQSGYQLLTCPASGSDNWRIRERTAPTTNFTLIAKISFAHQWVNSFYTGIVIVNNSNGKFIVVGAQTSTSGSDARRVLVYKWTNSTTFSADALSGSLPALRGPNSPVYLRIKKTGSTGVTDGSLAFACSGDGVSWADLGISEAVATFLGSADRIGFGGNGAAANKDFDVLAHWFRVS